MSAWTVRHYALGDIALRIRGLECEGPVRIHIEHKSGAALIVPTCDRQSVEAGFVMTTRGFDGTAFTFTLDEVRNTVRIDASAPTPILGGESSAVLARREDIEPALTPAMGPVRVTGEEPTLPIIIRDKGSAEQ